MTYKNILVHVDDREEGGARIRLALDLARKYKARLVGLAVMPLPTIPAGADGMGVASAEVLEIQEKANHDRLHAAERLFSSVVDGTDIPAEFHGVVADATGAMTDAIRYADLGIVGQREADQLIGDMYSSLPESLAMDSGRPIIVVPRIGYSKPIGHNVLLAWNDSAEASRAATEAMPLLEAADKVTLLVVDGEKARNGDAEAARPGEAAARWLQSHGVKVEIVNDVSDGTDVGSIILARVSNLDIDLVVMGIYGHSKLRETLFGGASKTMLGQMTVPTLIAH